MKILPSVLRETFGAAWPLVHMCKLSKLIRLGLSGTRQRFVGFVSEILQILHSIYLLPDCDFVTLLCL